MSWFFDNNVLIFKSEAKCVAIINFTSSCRAKKFILMMCLDIQSDLLYNI